MFYLYIQIVGMRDHCLYWMLLPNQPTYDLDIVGVLDGTKEPHRAFEDHLRDRFNLPPTSLWTFFLYYPVICSQAIVS